MKKAEEDPLLLLQRRMIKVRMNDNLVTHFEAQDTGFSDFVGHCCCNYPPTPGGVAQVRQVAQEYQN